LKKEKYFRKYTEQEKKEIIAYYERAIGRKIM